MSENTNKFVVIYEISKIYDLLPIKANCVDCGQSGPWISHRSIIRNAADDEFTMVPDESGYAQSLHLHLLLEEIAFEKRMNAEMLNSNVGKSTNTVAWK